MDTSTLISLLVALVTTALLLAGVFVIRRLNAQHKTRNSSFPYARNLWDPEIPSKTTDHEAPTRPRDHHPH
ncbi:hypothetical protein [Streptomyces liangshanensis]|uniref:hypothetical protein n=1 Tax=Streptomyces liangshanensis TaxID=2717324 RepID=UPI0036DADF58